MKRYYQGHEGVYQRLKKRGQNCWGNDDFENVHMLPFLLEALKHGDFKEPSEVRALVIGCGTGPLACVLAQRGFQVTGLDVSQTAIAMAQHESQSRGLKINYRVGDVCRDSLPAHQFGLILDSHCLHCIVPEDDRRFVLNSVRNALTDDGVFILETMMGYIRNDDAVSDQEGIVWTPYGHDEPDFEPRVLRDMSGSYHNDEYDPRKRHSMPNSPPLALRRFGSKRLRLQRLRAFSTIEGYSKRESGLTQPAHIPASWPFRQSCSLFLQAGFRRRFLQSFNHFRRRGGAVGQVEALQRCVEIQCHPSSLSEHHDTDPRTPA